MAVAEVDPGWSTLHAAPNFSVARLRLSNANAFDVHFRRFGQSGMGRASTVPRRHLQLNGQKS